MEVEEAKKALEERKAKLADLREQNASLTQDIEGLQKERTAAVRAFAAGDKTKRKIIHDLDRKIEPLGFRLEGMKGLIKDAEAEVENATAGLRKAVARTRRISWASRAPCRILPTARAPSA